MATPQEFQNLVSDSISLTENQLGSSYSSIASTLADFVKNGTCLHDILWAYDQANQQEPDPVGSYQKLARTPMQSCDGDNPYEVSDIDTVHAYEANVKQFTVKSGADWCKQCLDLVAKAPVSSAL